MVKQVVYTNSKCNDLWEMFINQNNKHSKFPLYLISDEIPHNLNYVDIYLYSNDEPYYDVWINALNKFGGDYFIYLQEDFILYDDVNVYKINEYVSFLENNIEYSFVRLLKSGKLNNVKVTDTLYIIEPDNENIFSMQSTIWKTVDYIRLLDAVRDYRWLENSNYRDKMISLNMKGLYHYNGENQRGLLHYDSDIYPYIATALVRGKWNIKEYSLELNKLLTEYNINLNKRGKI